MDTQKARQVTTLVNGVCFACLVAMSIRVDAWWSTGLLADIASTLNQLTLLMMFWLVPYEQFLFARSHRPPYGQAGFILLVKAQLGIVIDLVVPYAIVVFFFKEEIIAILADTSTLEPSGLFVALVSNRFMVCALLSFILMHPGLILGRLQQRLQP